LRISAVVAGQGHSSTLDVVDLFHWTRLYYGWWYYKENICILGRCTVVTYTNILRRARRQNARNTSTIMWT